MNNKDSKPEWTPEGAGEEFASVVKKGVRGGHDGVSQTRRPDAPANNARRRSLSTEEFVKGVLECDRTILARAITLVESNASSHIDQAQEMLKHLLPHAGRSIRIGITGVPGAGKSTFIEALGVMLCDMGKRVAVLAVDPSSSVTRGSILGDKTRMENLSRRKEAFIRPSPTGGALGGVARKSRETMLVCEAAGFDVVLVETVGVGQSEVTVRSMVDFFLLVLIAGAGDELQGMKKGVMELCDAVMVNKADGDNKKRALSAVHEFKRILHYLQPATEGWFTQALACSAMTGEGISDVWSMIERFKSETTASGVFQARRKSQTMDWVAAMVQEYLKDSFYKNPGVKKLWPEIEKAVQGDQISPTLAVHKLVERFEQGK